MSATITVRELALSFECRGEQLAGVISVPAAPSSDLALLVVVGGPQVRSGSHRQFTLLCRATAAAGVAAMRFDVRGMGDATGPLHTFEHVGPDIAAALDALQGQLPQVRRVVLWGLCDGASAALMHLHEHDDRRIAGLVLLNPWVRSAQTLARTHIKHYYWQRLRQREFWLKLLSGGVALRAARELLANVKGAVKGSVNGSPSGHGGRSGAAALPFQQRMLLGAEHFEGPVLWVLSGQDLTAREFADHVATEPRWQRLMGRAQHRRLDMPEADHTFSKGPQGEQLVQATVGWLTAGPRPGGTSA